MQEIDYLKKWIAEFNNEIELASGVKEIPENIHPILWAASVDALKYKRDQLQARLDEINGNGQAERK